MEKRWAIGLGLFLGALFGAGAPGSASAQVTIDGAPDSTQIIVDGSGDTFVGVWVHAPDAPRRGDRPPMALSLVIDTSGSMSGEKIANARMAAQSVLETLQEGDIVSIYGFSDAVTEYASPTVIGRGSRQSLMAAVQGLEATGSTNLYDGLRAGIARVGQAPASHTARRVIVLSDGQANVGPSDRARSATSPRRARSTACRSRRSASAWTTTSAPSARSPCAAPAASTTSPSPRRWRASSARRSACSRARWRAT